MAVKTFDTGELFYGDQVRGLPNGNFYAPYLPTSRQRLHRFSEKEIEFLDIGDHLYEKVASLPDRDLVALLDCGIAGNHPLLHPRIVASRDFTGEGITDSSGHGTMRALKSLLSQPTARFLVAKVVGTSLGTREALIEAIDWAIEQGAGVIYMALGEYNLLCRGGCRICRAALRAVDTHRVVIAAPGNRNARVACPAKARGVTSTVSTPWHFNHAYLSALKNADLSTIPAYFEYPGEKNIVLAEDILDLLGLSEWRASAGTELEKYRAAFRHASASGPQAYADVLKAVRQYLSNILTGPLPAQVVALDEIWARVPEKLLVALGENGLGLDSVFSRSMWVPIHGIPTKWSIEASVPREAPGSARYLITRWEYTWSNIARMVGRGSSFQTFQEKVASVLESHIAANPSDADAHFQLGVLYLMGGWGRGRCREPLLHAHQVRPNWPALSAALRQAHEEGLMT